MSDFAQQRACWRGFEHGEAQRCRSVPHPGQLRLLPQDLQHEGMLWRLRKTVSRVQVPVKWMAPESILERIYTSASDVWLDARQYS